MCGCMHEPHELLCGFRALNPKSAQKYFRTFAGEKDSLYIYIHDDEVYNSLFKFLLIFNSGVGKFKLLS